MSNECSTEKGQCSEAPQAKKDSECCEIPAKLLCAADEAWHELLKEKIKKQIETHNGEKLNKLAEVVAQANHQRWTGLIAQKQACNDYQEQVKEIMISLTK